VTALTCYIQLLNGNLGGKCERGETLMMNMSSGLDVFRRKLFGD
jgi:hypothetical protein